MWLNSLLCSWAGSRWKWLFIFLLHWWQRWPWKKSNCLLYKYVSAQHLIADSGDVEIPVLPFTDLRPWASGKTCTYRYLCIRLGTWLSARGHRADSSHRTRYAFNIQSWFLPFQGLSEYLFSTHMRTVIRNKMLVPRKQESEVDGVFLAEDSIYPSLPLLTQLLLLLRLIKVSLCQVLKQA